MDLADIPNNDTIIWLSHTKAHPAVRFFSHSLTHSLVLYNSNIASVFFNQWQKTAEGSGNCDEEEIVKSLEYPFKGGRGFESLAHTVA